MSKSLPPIMADVPEQPVELNVPFMPGQVGDERTPGVWRHTFREVPSAHSIAYLDMVTQVGASVYKTPDPQAGDMFAAIREGLAAGKRLADGNIELLRHATGVEDEEFLAALLPSQQEALVNGYEAVNPSVQEYKKKLEPLYREATRLLVARATDQMLRRFGEEKPTPSEPDTDSTPTSS